MTRFTREEIEAILMIAPHIDHAIHEDLSFWIDVSKATPIEDYMPLMKMFADRGYHPNHNKPDHVGFKGEELTIFFDWYSPAFRSSGFYEYPFG